MKNNIMLGLGLSGLMVSAMAAADGMLPQAMNNVWHPVIGLGGGVAIPQTLGKYTNFPIVDPLSDLYYTYTPNSGTPAKGLFEAFLGAERQIASYFILQSGLAYTYTGATLVKGTLLQGTDAQSDDLFNYQYKVQTQELLAQAKFMVPYQNKWYPYVLGGIGAAFNQASQFQTTVPLTLSSTRTYANHSSSTFAYRVGLGLDADVTKQVRLGLAYRFTGMGVVGLGAASMGNAPMSGTLSQSNLNFNEVLAQITYVI
jgi:opacity protein-like surface antigen